ncbi:hypothetical protein VOLCADRAFT_103977 [Volvox carteri f. nagariensis]|uniref:Transmembrane protein n=1 Tax=Volvox carteri f. nagariensis TaxID=3068 RepID=D8TQG1_VOLCA|nr:uncharacterized protein VOLCADRAFT_103977 [Volvox carteri f. nagariensis]EFJ50528.1 hypothetical protein VOLCADRAFT_103977 [Volvox carteri f. nagariensis]|eukprot:XP_002948653.1 hypothetical protein VOLCADRAFT_103977 [Volvox carteri f. nagariensis]
MLSPCLQHTQMEISYLGSGSSSAHVRVRRALAAGLTRHRVQAQIGSGSIRPTKSLELHASSGQPQSSVDHHLSQIPADPVDASRLAAQAASPAAVPDKTDSPTTSSSTRLAVSASSPSPASEDDHFADVWKPPQGEQPLWWVEKFEERRKAEAQRKAKDPTFITTLERVAPADGSAAAVDNPAVRFLKGVLQAVQLVLVLTLLLLLPAALHDGGLSLAKPFTTFGAYLCFFGFGTLARVVRYGNLAPRKQDQQVATWTGRLAFAAFVVVVPLLHLFAMYRFVGLALYTNAMSYNLTLYDIIGGVGMALATVLNTLAARHNYTRLNLVTGCGMIW